MCWSRWQVALGVALSACSTPSPSYVGAVPQPLDAEVGRLEIHSSPHAPSTPPSSDGPLREHERRAGLRWRFRAGSPSPGVAVDGEGTVYLPTHEGHVHAVGADGQFRWSYNCHAPATGVGVTPSGLLLVATNEGVLHGILPRGTGLWAYRAPFPLTTRLVVDQQGRVYVGDQSNHLVALSASGGARWRAPIAGGITAGPVGLPSGKVLVGTGDAQLVWVESLLERRVVKMPGVVYRTPAVLDDGTIVAVADNVLVAVRNGAEVWRVEGVEFVARARSGCVTVGEEGLCWRTAEGEVVRCAPFDYRASDRPAEGPEGQSFVPTMSGAVVVAGPQGTIERVVPVARAALWEPVVDADRGQVLVAAGDGVVGAMALNTDEESLR